MRPWLKVALVGAGVVILAAQIVRPPRTNPPEGIGHNLYAVVPVNANIAAVLNRSCNDCHSHSTVWPWYSQVAPASWMVALDVHRGRKAMNFSEWTSYSPKRQRELLTDACEEVAKGEMPAAQYVAIHREARLNFADRQLLCDWAHRAAGPMSEAAGE
jgi:hypothetical protein